MIGAGLAGALCCALAAPRLAAQAPAARDQNPVPVVKVSRDVVNVFAVVRDKKGRLIPDLKKEDFGVSENDARQDIRYFSRETDTPLTLGILVDTSPSQRRVLPLEQEEAKAFIRQVLRPKDLACVVHFDVEVEVLRDFTSDVAQLDKAIDDTQIGGGEPAGILPSPLPTASPRGTLLYDAVYLAANQLLKNEIGRKVIILLTDGEDQGSSIKLEKALEAAQKADVIVYSLNISDRMFYFAHGMGYGGESALRKLSTETGGRVIDVNRKSDVGKGFIEIADELRTQYQLGYSPSDKNHDGRYRKVRVWTPKLDTKVQARRGYYAPLD